MSLKTDLNTLADKTGKTFRQTREYPAEELACLAKEYGIDTHELAFIYEAAVHGKLDRVRGIDLDMEAVVKVVKVKERSPVPELEYWGLVPVEEVDDAGK